ncbi:hypothetical protein [Phyllobacterium phragmitis]|uniref:hypothetical protein n=1 Tax=Phyllobacterium phragmitis TaxID=2670329 RepID=UPI0011B2950D|nr:hypothetical protein [Phyllobacterium phragmitis]
MVFTNADIISQLRRPDNSLAASATISLAISTHAARRGKRAMASLDFPDATVFWFACPMDPEMTPEMEMSDEAGFSAAAVRSWQDI